MSLTFDHIGVAARDPARTLAFYVRLLDGVAREMPGHVAVVAGAVRIAVVPRRDDDPDRYAHGHHLALRAPVAERDAILARLEELGAAYEDVRGRVYTRDPDGLTLELLFD